MALLSWAMSEKFLLIFDVAIKLIALVLDLPVWYAPEK
ncbi:hypothetical protein CRYPA_1438 [uncultured Candidatus Thioglobus sp.]|nr:hypothetical protein CRYPA_1438 [uncultured Candidatus Thioglobus sp.]